MPDSDHTTLDLTRFAFKQTHSRGERRPRCAYTLPSDPPGAGGGAGLPPGAEGGCRGAEGGESDDGAEGSRGGAGRPEENEEEEEEEEEGEGDAPGVSL